MIEMSDVRERLRRASGLVTPPDRPFERMIERRDRKRRSQRLASAAVAQVGVTRHYDSSKPTTSLR